MPPLSPVLPDLTSLPGERSTALRRLLGRPWVFLLVILFAQLMVVLDGTIVNVALPHIQTGLHMSASGLSWVLNAYILTAGGILLLGARAGDLVGRRRVFLGGIAVFTLGSLLGGLATAGWMLLSARALQGVGAAFAAPSALSLLTTAYPEGAARLRAIALYTTVSAAGGAVGLVAGGILTQLVSWRWVMFVNVPIGLLVWLVGRVVLHETSRRPGRFDLAGALSSTLGMSALIYGLVEAGSNSWSSASAVGPLLLGAALLVLFVLNERRVAEPILPLELLANGTRSAANAARGLVYAGMYGMFFFLSQFLQDTQHYSPLRAGLAFLPMPFSVFVWSQLTSRVFVRRFPTKAVMVGGFALATAGLALATGLAVSSPYAQILASMLLVGAGSGISFVSTTSAALAGVEPRHAGAASGLINVAQQMGGAVGLAVLVNVFGLVTDHASIAASATSAGAHAVDGTVMHGLHEIFSVAALFSLAALAVVALFVQTAPRSPHQATELERLVDGELLEDGLAIAEAG